jgi:nucleotide-binding universal stress UspA family protein
MGRPTETITDIAQEWGADLIVVGSHGHDFWGRMTLGSVSDGVIHHAKCSVLVVREPH